MQTPDCRKAIADSEPSYRSFRHLPEQERWQWYENAKRIRQGREAAGIEMTEPYETFIARITRELEI